MAATDPVRSRDYLRRSLETAACHRRTPIISAEIISALPRNALASLRIFLGELGWTPRVILYVRAPLDLLESRFQQRLRAGAMPSLIPRRLPDYMKYCFQAGYSPPLELLDEVFGRENVTLQWFDPRRFPHQCVVRHFCNFAGIPIRDVDIVRENDSLSVDAIRFVYALMLAGRRREESRIDRLHRAVLLGRLGELAGPAIRFAPGLTAPFVERISREMAWVEERLSEALPLSLHQRDSDEGVRCEADLVDFTAESLEWLAKACGRRVVRHGRGSETVNAVVEQLESIGAMGDPQLACRVVLTRVRELWQRATVRRRNLG